MGREDVMSYSVGGPPPAEIRKAWRDLRPEVVREATREATSAVLLGPHRPRHLLTPEGLACGIEIGKRRLRVTTDRAKVTCFYCHFAAVESTRRSEGT